MGRMKVAGRMKVVGRMKAAGSRLRRQRMSEERLTKRAREKTRVIEGEGENRN